MPYVPPFNLVKQRIRLESIDGSLKVSADYQTFTTIIRDLLRGVTVDEEWYLLRYPDVIESGMSPRQHFAEHGYFEGRLPSPLAIDEGWYLEHYADVAEQIASGEMPNALTHFKEHGYIEGRLPSPF